MSWTERQGQVGDMTKQSKEELQDLLLRQEKILSNKRLLQTLPDKGLKIRDFAEKIRQAIEQHEEAKMKERLISVARMEFESKYYQAFTMQQRTVHNTSDVSAAGGVTQDSPIMAQVQENKPETTDDRPSLNSNHIQDTELVEALERVKISTGSSTVSKKTSDNYFEKTHPPAKPYYISVIEKAEKTPSSRKPKFKPNQVLSRDYICPSGSSSPSQSSETVSPLSAQERKVRDRKHLDNITAATLPPLHHCPAQLLSLEQSANLLRDQMKKQQELQAKLAAQKLSEGLKISMGSCTPDGGPMAAYREVHDEGAQLSSEED